MNWPDAFINKVICGDCLEVMKHIPDGAVDLVVTDPPYGVGFKGKATKFHGPKGDAYQGFDDNNKYIDCVVLPAITLAMSKVTRMVITPGTRQCFKYPQPAEIGGVFCPGGAGISRWGFTCLHPILYYGNDPQRGCHPNSFQSNAIAAKNGHPCPKPIEWMHWLVNRASLNNDIILDPFLGSGTTAVAAKQLGRKYIGIEINPDYCKIAEDRLRQTELF
jgi:DNA modification methylase